MGGCQRRGIDGARQPAPTVHGISEAEENVAAAHELSLRFPWFGAHCLSAAVNEMISNRLARVANKGLEHGKTDGYAANRCHSATQFPIAKPSPPSILTRI